eukprot:m.86161 g.86161  ORF g.86161 m.86161 type:complete len:60 (-) comp16372_c0_seq15:2469-2648(-)
MRNGESIANLILTQPVRAQVTTSAADALESHLLVFDAEAARKSRTVVQRRGAKHTQPAS